ncbi:MAG: hemolysin family protein [Verrucomicrobia bacterium]|jgi:CBS domain containing-hemolysin-like protein|nr:hemolysin family protein [Verrucomicrobiota bacterium]
MERAPLMAAIAVLVFAGASFFFALAETALFSLGQWQARQLAERHPRRGGIVARLLDHPQDLLAAMVLGNTFATAAMLAIALWMALNGHWPIVTTVVGLLALILIGGEVLPKTLAVRRPEQWSLRVAPALLVFEKLALPLRWFAQKLNEAILKLLVPQSIKPQSALTDADYQELLELATQQGTLAEAEKEIILQIISLDHRTAKDVMKPRSRMACVSDDLSVEEMIEAARKFKHRRLPMYDETPDTIVGILNTRALLLDPQIDLADAIEFPSFVPESMNLLQLLKSMQRQQRGMAIVLDEFGGTAGVVTMEDILSELVGKIRGEVASEGFVMEKLGAGRWRVNGTMRLDDFRREYPSLGEVPEIETLGGLLTHLIGVVPGPGESAAFRGLKFTAQVTDERRVRELLVEQMK